MNQQRREELDKVTVKQIRGAFEHNLEKSLEDFANLCRERKLDQLQSQFDVIKDRIKNLIQLDVDAGLSGMLKSFGIELEK